MVGLIAVGLFVGLTVGRSTERARRGMKDLSAAKTALTKGRQIAYGELRKAAGAVLIVGVVMIALFIGVMKSQS
jgi:hypothetical protein